MKMNPPDQMALTHAVEALDFPQAASEVIPEVRNCFTHLLSELGISEVRPQRIADGLSIDLNLARKLHTVVQTSDRFASARGIPGRGGLRIIIQAARSRGVSETTIRRLESALDAYHRLLTVHAGDRASLDSMLGHLASEGTERTDLNTRRQAFRANASIFGVQARLQTDTVIVYPGTKVANSMDVMLLRGFADFQRLANGRQWVIGRSLRTSLREPSNTDCKRRPIGSDAFTNDQVPIIKEFSDVQSGSLQRYTLDSGMILDKLVDGQVGRRGIRTFFMGEVLEPFGIYNPLQRNTFRLGARCYTPCELMLFDVLVHPDSLLKVQPEYFISSEIDGSDPHFIRSDELMKLPVCESLEHRSVAGDGLLLPELAQYQTFVHACAEKEGLDLSEYFVWRVLLKYAPTPSLVFMEWIVSGTQGLQND